ncbi:hypothetical protein [Treponema sp. OMZ 805]|uniref:hypothetical protein n=1 Tax=Treponema sp. OMZ 805 TaxID=2726068 RepID=UPI003D8AFB1D
MTFAGWQTHRLDDFDRAIEAGKKTGEESAAAFMQGVVMIRNGLSSLLESKYGLQYYEVQEKAYPNLRHFR